MIRESLSFMAKAMLILLYVLFTSCFGPCRTCPAQEPERDKAKAALALALAQAPVPQAPPLKGEPLGKPIVTETHTPGVTDPIPGCKDCHEGTAGKALAIGFASPLPKIFQGPPEPWSMFLQRAKGASRDGCNEGAQGGSGHDGGGPAGGFRLRNEHAQARLPLC